MKYVLVFVFITLLIHVSTSLALELVVGVYDNPPLVSRDGLNYVGLYIDILEYIADKEGWLIVYDYDHFPNLLKKLENGQIDLMTAIAYSEERAELFNFTNETILSNWGVVVSKDRYNSIFELKNLRIVGVKGDVYTENFKKLLKSFDVECEVLEVEGDYITVFDALKSDLADAGIVSRIYGSLYAKDYGLQLTNIIFSPVELRFASKNKTILSIIDGYLAEMKKDKSSIYYQSFDRWFGVKADFRENVPSWIYQTIGSMIFLAFLLAFGIVLMSREIKKRTKKLAENEKLLRTIFDTIQDGISLLDREMNVIMVNKAMEKWYSRNRPLVGRKCYKVYRDRDEPCEDCPTLKSISSGKIEKAIVPGLKGSEVEWLELFCYPIFDEDGKVKMVVEFVRDITARKKAEDKLRETFERYEYLWENANDVMFIHNLAGNFIKVNKKAYEVFGYKEGSNITIWDIVDENYHEFVRERINEVLKSKKPSKAYELPCKTIDGRTVWLKIVAHPLFRQGEVFAIHGIARDVTERKKLTEKLEKDIELIAMLIDRVRNDLTSIRGFCELYTDLGPEAIKKALTKIDELVEILSELDKAWKESEEIRDYFFKPK